jgi:hypothetical protein
MTEQPNFQVDINDGRRFTGDDGRAYRSHMWATAVQADQWEQVESAQIPRIAFQDEDGDWDYFIVDQIVLSGDDTPVQVDQTWSREEGIRRRVILPPVMAERREWRRWTEAAYDMLQQIHNMYETPRSGRPPKWPERARRTARALKKHNPRMTSHEIRDQLAHYGDIPTRTIRDWIKDVS